MTAIIISVASSIISGMVLFFLQRFFKKKAKKDEERDAMKAKENKLIIKSIDATDITMALNTICLKINFTFLKIFQPHLWR